MVLYLLPKIDFHMKMLSSQDEIFLSVSIMLSA